MKEPWRNRAFTLVELLVAMAITTVILALLLHMIGSSSSQWKSTHDNAEAYQAARAAFDSLTRTLSQATLNTEYDYYDAARRSRLVLAAQEGGAAQLKNFQPDTYGRLSALHFICGKALVDDQQTHAIFFQAPLNFDTAPGGDGTASGQLNAVGYFVRFGSDAANRPPNISATEPAPRNRFRLMQYLQPTLELDTYRDVAASAWFSKDVNADPAANVHVLAENIVVLVILPKLPDEAMQPADAIAPDYEYDSRMAWGSGGQPVQMHQLPPVVRVLMVAVDETSASHNPELGRGFNALFRKPAEFDDDLAEVETELNHQHVNYRVFQTDVPIRAAKWSR